MARRQLAARVAPNETGRGRSGIEAHWSSLARKIAENDATVLITGESGTGKEVYARFIRDNSARARQAVRRHQLRGDSREHARGDPVRLREGRVHRRAGARTPENSSRPRAARCCSMKSPRWILGCRQRFCACCRSARWSGSGSSRTISLDVRVIATSNRDLPEEVRAGALSRRPLLPPQCDVAAPARLARAPRRHSAAGAPRDPGLRARRPGAAEPVRRMRSANCSQHDWPGNARELTNIVQRAAWLACGGRIDAADLDLASRAPAPRRGDARAAPAA